MYKHKRTVKKSNKRKILLIITGVLFITAIVAGSAFFLKSKSDNATVSTPSTSKEAPVNYSPPTPEDIQQSQDKKDDLSSKPGTDGDGDVSTPNPSSSLNATLTRFERTSGLEVEAAGNIAGIYEDGGTCTYTFTSGSNSVKATSVGVLNASNTICPPATTKLPSVGAWTASLSYVSKNKTQSSNTSNEILITL